MRYLKEKTSRITDCDELFYEFRDFTQSKRINRECVTAKTVLEYLIEKNYCVVKLLNNSRYVKQNYEAAARATRRYLEKKALKEGHKRDLFVLNQITLSGETNTYVTHLLIERWKSILMSHTFTIIID